ncbi:hypothetical protein Agabi119p4_9956 [Agaricus bisporus var. burnettii]|uniref:Uncharacterized protein n=1 Tax=Agaricus bisporus var. burnettii TaxID=192524 RepID=A0A8H7EXA4_AGABI|nr:hypothetical protein Agabi119p4_9956 [Agaricus bisporus var. burnettii]
MPPSISLLFGPILIGALINAILYGVLVVQSLIYFQTYKKDNGWLKCLVFYLFTVETINSGLIIALVYEPLILKYGQSEAMSYFPLRKSNTSLSRVG